MLDFSSSGIESKRSFKAPSRVFVETFLRRLDDRSFLFGYVHKILFHLSVAEPVPSVFHLLSGREGISRLGGSFDWYLRLF